MNVQHLGKCSVNINNLLGSYCGHHMLELLIARNFWVDKPKSGALLGTDSLLRDHLFIQNMLIEHLLYAVRCVSEEKAVSRTG